MKSLDDCFSCWSWNSQHQKATLSLGFAQRQPLNLNNLPPFNPILLSLLKLLLSFRRRLLWNRMCRCLRGLQNSRHLHPCFADRLEGNTVFCKNWTPNLWISCMNHKNLLKTIPPRLSYEKYPIKHPSYNSYLIFSVHIGDPMPPYTKAFQLSSPSSII